MAIEVLAVQEMNRTGIDADEVAIEVGNTYRARNNGRMFFHFKKVGVGDAVISVVTPNDIDGLAIADKTFTVAGETGDVHIGPWPRDVYNDGSGNLEFTTSEGTELTCSTLAMA